MREQYLFFINEISKLLLIENREERIVFNHHYQIEKPLLFGKIIETLLYYNIYKTNLRQCIYRANICTLGRNCLSVYTPNVSFLNTETVELSDFELQMSLELFKFSSDQYFGDYKLDTNDVDFCEQFKLMPSVLRNAERFLLSTSIDRYNIDLIIDDTIIDIKTDKNFHELKKHLKQVMRHYISYNSLISIIESLDSSKLRRREFEIINKKINKVGWYFYRFNLLIKFDVEVLMTQNSDFKGFVKDLSELFLTDRKLFYSITE